MHIPTYLVVLTASLIAAATGTQAAKFCVGDNAVCVTSTVQGTDMLFEVVTIASKGWVGIGFDAKTMDGADIIVRVLWIWVVLSYQHSIYLLYGC